MTFWTRLSRSRLIVLSSIQSRSCYYVRYRSSPNCLAESPNVGPIFLSSSLYNNIKLYSSSPREKFKTNDIDGPLLNEQIQHQYVRLVTDDGHNVLPSWQALSMAKKLNLDLVLVDSERTPPVCKIFDYRKTKYDKKVREKERIKSKATIRKGDCKEVRFSVKTEHKDLKMKADQIKRLMEDGYRVKCVAMPLKHSKKLAGPSEEGDEKIGEEMKSLFKTLILLIEEEAIMECEPAMKGGQGHLIVRHKKFGPTKKGTSNKSTESKSSSSDLPVVEHAPSFHPEAPVQEAIGYSIGEVKQDWNSSLPFPQPIPRAAVFVKNKVADENNRYARKPVVNVSERDQVTHINKMRGSGLNRYDKTPNLDSSERDKFVSNRGTPGSEMNRYDRTSRVNVIPNEYNKEMRSSENNRYNKSRAS